MTPDSKPVIVWKKPASAALSEAAFAEALRGCLRGRVEAAFLFGSIGTANYHSGSDVDLILVKETREPFWERVREFDDLYDLHPRLDLLIYRKEELASLLAEQSGFWKSVRETMRQILP